MVSRRKPLGKAGWLTVGPYRALPEISSNTSTAHQRETRLANLCPASNTLPNEQVILFHTNEAHIKIIHQA